MGASFVPADFSGKSEDGYARKALSPREAAACSPPCCAGREVRCCHHTTANIPGRTAPILLDENAIAGMAPGSVIVDMAAVNGGNCALTVPGEGCGDCQ